MKKAMIVTLFGEYNYGNRLQNYAVSEFLKHYNIDSDTIKNIALLNENDKYFLRLIKYYLKSLFSSKQSETDKVRNKNFKIFDSNIKIDYQNFNFFKINKYKRYDYYIVGSDQIWNCNFGCLRDFDLLTFTDSKNKISFSASFGVDKLPNEYKEKTAKYLKQFKAISVREETGKKIVEDLTGRKDVVVLADPTMLLTNEEWDKVSKKPDNFPKKKYILNYFLGKLSDDRIKEINKVAKENDCEIINILDKNSPYYVCGPSEFIYLEKHAFLICTDSFHSSVFAILYNRPFIVFNREDNNISMNSRIDTLLKKFKLQDRYYNGKIDKKLLTCDYTESYKVLEKERQKAKDFLDKAISS